ncbi:hypothetical protein [Senimuribacter intestinalis]|uniref:hypothetical protein n=1 Tax=Senimuribacter intestinalis TaxID=2941507 RepID=UPI00204032C1|nr:hypothetical protein [Senimuribacter intestinalis]
MKNYELMERLSSMPAGAEIEVRAIMTIEEFKNSDIMQEDEEGALYGLTRGVEDVENDGNRIYMYTREVR